MLQDRRSHGTVIEKEKWESVGTHVVEKWEQIWQSKILNGNNLKLGKQV